MPCIGYARSNGRVGAEFAQEIPLDRLFEKTPTPMLALLASTLPASGREKKVPGTAMCEGPNAGS
jgi:hypothetical protein